MSKHLQAPVSRLICLGGAKASTNANGGESPEIDGGPLFN
jgi:hypothetical protein